MRFLADMGVSMTTVEALRVLGHDAIHLREEGLHRLPDPEILAKGDQEKRIVLTFNLDFGDLLAASGEGRPSVILFRLRAAGVPEAGAGIGGGHFQGGDLELRTSAGLRGKGAAQQDSGEGQSVSHGW